VKAKFVVLSFVSIETQTKGIFQGKHCKSKISLGKTRGYRHPCLPLLTPLELAGDHKIIEEMLQRSFIAIDHLGVFLKYLYLKRTLQALSICDAT